MGLIIDTTLFVNLERTDGAISGLRKSGALRRTGEKEFGVCAITLMELTYGHWRSAYRMDEEKRLRILNDLRDNFAIYSIDERTAIRAGKLNFVLGHKGVTIGLGDLLIAATALDLGFGVLTHNVKHFEYVPNLRVVNAADE